MNNQNEAMWEDGEEPSEVTISLELSQLALEWEIEIRLEGDLEGMKVETTDLEMTILEVGME